MTDLAQIVKDSGLADVLLPPEQLRHDAAMRQTVDAAGRIDPTAAAPLRTPITLDWSTIDGRPKRSPQSGALVLIWAHANTAPSSGPCVIQYTMETKTQGATPIGTVTIAQGQAIGEANLSQPLPAGAYLNPTITSAGGASAVSTGVVIKGGA